MPRRTRTEMPVHSPEQINFDKYTRLYENLYFALADVSGDEPGLFLRCIITEDHQLEELWTDVKSAERSLSSLLDAFGRHFSAATTGDLEPLIASLNDYDRLFEAFPPTSRPEFEARVVRFRDALVAYHEALSAKFESLLRGTKLPDEHIGKDLPPTISWPGS